MPRGRHSPRGRTEQGGQGSSWPCGPQTPANSWGCSHGSWTRLLAGLGTIIKNQVSIEIFIARRGCKSIDNIFIAERKLIIQCRTCSLSLPCRRGELPWGWLQSQDGRRRGSHDPQCRERLSSRADAPAQGLGEEGQCRGSRRSPAEAPRRVLKARPTPRPSTTHTGIAGAAGAVGGEVAKLNQAGPALCLAQITSHPLSPPSPRPSGQGSASWVLLGRTC